MPDYFSVDELKQLGFSHIGREVKVSRKCSFYAIAPTSYIGDCTRIDDFCIFKGDIRLGSFIHIAAYVMISAVGGPCIMEDLSFLAARTTVYTSSDNYSASETLLYATLPKEDRIYSKLVTGPVRIEVGAFVGAHCLVMPGSTIGAAASIGANCLVNGEFPPGAVMRAPPSQIRYWTRNPDKVKEFAVRVLENWDKQREE